MLLHLLMIILLVIGLNFLLADQFRHVIKQKMHMSVYIFDEDESTDWRFLICAEFAGLAYHHVA